MNDSNLTSHFIYPKPANSPFSKWKIPAVILSVVLVGIAIWYFWSNTDQPKNLSQETPAVVLDSGASNWLTYDNKEYGFEFTYPASLGSLAQNIHPNNYRESGLYVEGPGSTGARYTKYKDRVLPIVSLIAQTSDNSSQNVVTLNIFDLNKYRFIANSVGAEYGYDLDTDSWWINSTNGKKTFISEKVNGGYKFRTGDAGFTKDVFVIPEKEKDVMIEIGLEQHETSQVIKSRVTIDQILASFKFVGPQVIAWDTQNEGDFTGYYIKRENVYGVENTGPYACDSFIATKGDKIITDYFKNIWQDGNTINDFSGGNFEFNLDLSKVSAIDKNKIINSTLNSPIRLTLKKKIEPGRGASPCHSFFEILGISK
jgi:hypothetical protein